MRSAFIAVAFVFSTFVALAQIPLSFPHLVVFGDNYSDTVNTYNATATTTLGYDSSGNPVTLFDAFPYPTYDYTAGAFTNGSDTITGSSTQYHSVWHAQLHTLLPGVPLAATPLNSGQSTAGNTNYAWGSATTGTGKTNVTYAGHFTVAVHNLDQQVTDYLNAGYTPDASSLYVLFAGLNDLLQDTSANGINTAAANVTTEAKRLIDAGAVNLLIPNVPGISANPSSPIDIAAAAFRTQLAADISALEAQYASQNKTVHITTLDLYTLYANIRLTPATFGFTDVMDPADAIGSNGFAPSNVDQYLTWDGTNPTTAGHHQIALAACTALAGTATTLSINNAAPTVA
jgi:phospholipase/lecithinase/hemolysin